MGERRHEIPRIRKGRDHPPGRAVPLAGSPNPGEARHSKGHVLRWYDLHRTGGPEALGDRSPRPGRVWNRIPEEIRGQIIDLALEQPELASRELAGRFTHERQDFLSEAAGYPLLKGPDPIPSPAHK